jgi:hypothetical protein
MKTVLLAACIAVALPAAAADQRETRTVGEFDGLGVSAPIRVELRQGEGNSLVVEGEESALAELETYVEKGSLHMRQRGQGRVKHLDKVKAFVTLKEVRAIAAAGSGDIIAGPLRGGEVKLAVAGSGDLRIAELNAHKVHAAVAGSGGLRISGGKADSIEAVVAGSGDLKAGELEAGNVQASVAGSGSAWVWARSSLKASVLGSGDLRYYGDPSERSTAVRGSGSLRRVGANPS